MVGVIVSDVAKKAILSALLSIPSAIVGIVTSKVLEKWGVLSPFSEWLGGWLKMYVSPSQAGWTIAGVITLSAYAALLWFVWKRQLAGVPATDHLVAISRSGHDAPKSTANPLSIELGTDQNHERIEHFDNGLLRRSIYVAVCNNSDADIHDSNIRLTTATPRLKTGDADTSYPVFFVSNFDLSTLKRKYIKILSFAESGAPTTLERDSILLSAAVGGFFGGWTTMSPLPTQDNPGILSVCPGTIWLI